MESEMENKPYLVGITSDYGINGSAIAPYLQTLSNLAGSVESILISYNPQVDLNQCGWVDQIRRIDEAYPGNLLRFKDFPMDLDPERMVIFTDVGDVTFQHPIPKLEKGIYVCPEYDIWGKDNWWKDHLEAFDFHNLDGESIYNMGTWAMPTKKVYEMINFLEKNAHLFGHWQACDQPLFNLWLQNQEFTTHPSLMTCLYDGLNYGSVRREKKSILGTSYLNREGYLFSIVHKNGGTKELWISGTALAKIPKK